MNYLFMGRVPADFADNEYNSLHHAVLSYNCTLDIIQNIVRQHPSSLNSQNYYKETPLHCALHVQQRPEIILELLCLGADANAKNNRNLSPLHIAICKYDRNLFDVVQYLVQYGTDVNCTDSMKLSPLHYLLKKKCIPVKTLRFLLENGANTNPTEMFSDSIMREALHSSGRTLEIVKLLLKYGAKPTRDDCNYLTHLGLATFDIAKILLQYVMVEEIMAVEDLESFLVLSDYFWGNVATETSRDNENSASSTKVVIYKKSFLKEFILMRKKKRKIDKRATSCSFTSNRVCDRSSFWDKDPPLKKVPAGYSTDIVIYKKSLLNELVVMKQYKIDERTTLLSFISNKLSDRSSYWDKDPLMNKVLAGFSSTDFVCSQYIIEESLKDYKLLSKLKELDIYAMESHFKGTTVRKISLNYDVISYLVSYLSKKDVVNLVLAYWKKESTDS